MYNTNRRTVLKSLGTAVCLGQATTGSTQARKAQSTPPDEIISDFRVIGTKKAKVTFKPNTITVEVTYKSSDLKKRYGVTPPKFTETTEYDRTEVPAEHLPTQGVKTRKQRWETHYATESEWQTFFKARQKRKRMVDSGVSIQHDHEPIEDAYCGRAIRTYEKQNGFLGRQEPSYTISSPINVVLYGMDISDVRTVLQNNLKWDDLEDTIGIPNELNRYAWDKDREMFIGPDNEPKSAYGGWGSTRGFGIRGRIHVRCWELEDGIVSIQAHEDGNWDPLSLAHDVVSYENAKSELEDIFTNNWPYLQVADRVDSGPDGWGNDGESENHNGKAVILEPSSITPDPVDKQC